MKVDIAESIPIIKLEDILLVVIQREMDDKVALELLDNISRKIKETETKGILIDISGVAMVDSFIGRILGNIAAVGVVMDAVTVIAGIQPAVAITLVEMGVPFKGVRTVLNADKGVALLRKLMKENSR